VRAYYHKLAPAYPASVPFDPPESYPELASLGGTPTDPSNEVYAAVRTSLRETGLDAAHAGTAEWNPLRELVGEGRRILIKPNLVTHHHYKGDQGLTWMISHPSVLRCLADYARLAVGPSGRVTIGDVPIENCDFEHLCAATHLRRMCELLVARGFGNLELLDFRTFQTKQFPDGSVEQTSLPGDPRGYTRIDLGARSLFQELENQAGAQNYYTLGDHSVDQIDPHTTRPGMPNRHHYSGRHEYNIPNTVLDADLLISVAKLKTHKFSGVTLSLKNAIGISQGKEFLPHRRPGTPAQGGDSFPELPSSWYVNKLRLRRSVISFLGAKNVDKVRGVVRRYVPPPEPHKMHQEPLYGNWIGNDTIWRTTLDLNLVLMHADREGFDLAKRPRKFLAVIDGVIGMDHEAPMAGLPVPAGLLVVGRDPVAADTLATYLMGYDPRDIRTIAGASRTVCRALGDVTLLLRDVGGSVPLEEAKARFVPAKGWAPLLAKGIVAWPFAN
jgi:uncharacterized protein (DUF362 family)